MDIVVRGAGGSTGGRVLARAATLPELRDVRWVLVDAGVGAVGETADALQAHGCEVVRYDGDPDPTAGACVLDLADPTTGAVERACRTLARGAHYLGLGRAASAWHDAADELDRSGAEHGAVAVASLGYDAVVADLLAGLLLQQPEARELHVVHLLDRRWRSWRSGGAPGRAEAATALAGPVVHRTHGVDEVGRVAEDRRLAWFPRPLGPHHAASLPSLETVTIGRRAPELERLGSYAAMSTRTAELLQAAAPLLARRAARPGRPRPVTPGRSQEPDQRRWAVVVEASSPVVGGETGVLGARPGVVSRAWSHGRDPDAVTAAVIVDAVVALRGYDGGGGLLAPSALIGARPWLDDLADRGLLQWRKPDIPATS